MQRAPRRGHHRVPKDSAGQKDLSKACTIRDGPGCVFTRIRDGSTMDCSHVIPRSATYHDAFISDIDKWNDTSNNI
jgi:hypothetical protein